MKILIDFRLSNASGIGRYISNISQILCGNLIHHEFTFIINKDQDVPTYIANSNIIYFYSKPLTLSEQIEFMKISDVYDIYWAPHFNFCLLKRIASNTYITIHDLTPLNLAVYKISLSYLYLKFSLLVIKWRRINVFTVSNFVKQELIKIIPNNAIDVTYNGTCFLPLENDVAVSNENKYFLFVGNFKQHKNVSMLVKLWMNHKMPQDLILAGNLKKIRRDKFFKGLNPWELLKYNVKIIENPSDSSLANLYKNATGFIFPSFSEGFGLPILEAQHFGCPVLCSDASCLPEIGGDSVLYFSPYDSMSLFTAINTLISDERMRVNLITKGFKNISRFSWATTEEIIRKKFITPSRQAENF